MRLGDTVSGLAWGRLSRKEFMERYFSMKRIGLAYLSLIPVLFAVACQHAGGASESALTHPAERALMEGLEFDVSAVEGFDPADFTTYAIVGFGAIEDPSGRWARPEFDIRAEIRFLVESALRERGWYPVTRNPDAYVVVLAAVDSTQVWQILEHSGGLMQPQMAAGGLLVQVRSGQTKEPLWAASALGPVRTEETQWTDQQARRRLAYGVEQIFARFGGK